ncbi:MAG: MBL fold metallo-hydrolase [Flavobacteriales bacterium]|nr:MBL fold metallo-hydrolase [Flavobacteriales bacterium]
MHITFVNHASFIVQHGRVRLICDPWLEGTAFDDGWSLLSATVLRYEEFATITHIWFSHEHPDHFSPPNLLKIPPGSRANITVLFQATVDRKVVDFCRKAGFKELVELKAGVPYDLGDQFTIRCDPYTDGDSYALFATPELRLLNLNDCVVNDAGKAAALASAVGTVDVLFTQFGYANKVGNSADDDARARASAEKLERIRHQVRQLRPKWVVPFASFVTFGHEENAYMNRGMNSVQRVHAFVENDLQLPCVVLYPGDNWIPGEPHDSTASVERYRTDEDHAEHRPLLTGRHVEWPELRSAASTYGQRLLEKAGPHRKNMEALRATIHITDLGLTCALTTRSGLTEVEQHPGTCDVALTSGALHYALSHLWGGDTLNVNARFQTPAGGMYQRFRLFGAAASLINRGESLDELFPSFTQRIKGRLARFVGR